MERDLKCQLGSHTLLTTLFTFWITGFLTGTFLPSAPKDTVVFLIVGTFVFPAIVSLPIWGILICKARQDQVERRTKLEAVLLNILVTAGLTVLIFHTYASGELCIACRDANPLGP